MKAILKVDTTSNKEIEIGLLCDGGEFTLKQELDKHKAQALLPLIDKILSEKKMTLKDITAIKVNPGPGSYTGIRVGLSIVNLLGILLNVPVNDSAPGEIVEPVY